MMRRGRGRPSKPKLSLIDPALDKCAQSDDSIPADSLPAPSPLEAPSLSYYRVSRKHAGNPAPVPRQSATSTQAAPAMAHIDPRPASGVYGTKTHSGSSSSGLPMCAVRLGAREPYILRPGSLEPLPSMRGLEPEPGEEGGAQGKGSSQWDLGFTLRSRSLLLLRNLYDAVHGPGVAVVVPSSQQDAWTAHLLDLKAELLALGEPAAEWGFLDKAVAMLMPLHHPAAASEGEVVQAGQALTSWGQYSSCCVLYQDGHLTSGLNPDSKHHRYLRVSLGWSRQSAGSAEAGLEAEAEAEVGEQPPVGVLTRSMHRLKVTGSNPAASSISTSSSSHSSPPPLPAAAPSQKMLHIREHAHRLLVWMVDGPPPSADAEILHMCHNPQCLNPQHLVWGTRGENMEASSCAYKQAMARAGRHEEGWLWAGKHMSPPGMRLQQQGGAAPRAPKSPGAKRGKGKRNKGAAG